MTSTDMNDTPAGNEAGGPRAGQPRRRTFSTAYKLAMVREYDSATRPGEKGAILRREGLYDSHITDWRKARGAGRLGPGTRGILFPPRRSGSRGKQRPGPRTSG